LSDNRFNVCYLRHYALMAVFVALLLIFSLGGEFVRMGLRYELGSILQHHEIWRLLTGHLVHGSWQHTWLNLTGLLVVAVLFRQTYSALEWIFIGLFSALSIDFGLIFFMPHLQWYLGLSGVLHGLLAAGTVAWWRLENRGLAVLLFVMLIAKLTWEQWQGALPLSGELNVIVNAHLYGAIGGLLAGAGLYFKAVVSRH